MNTLTTRKIVLGMLMTLVLVFSVQGIAGALTFKESRSGDLQTLLPGDTFTIRFSVNLNSSKDIFDTDVTPKRQEDETGIDIDSSGYKVRSIKVDGKDKYFRISESRIVDNSGYVIVEGAKDDPTSTSDPPAQLEPGDRDKDTDGLIKAEPDDPVSDSLQHHYNDEAIAIFASPALASLERSGTRIRQFTTAPARPTNLPTDLTNVSLIEETKNRELDSDLTLSSSITLTGRVGGANKYTIQVVDMTHTSDFPTNDQPFERAILSFTIYVVPSAERATTLTREAANAELFGNDLADPQINNLFGFTAVSGSATTNLPIIYEVQGSGRVYVKETYTNAGPDSVGSAAKRLETSNGAPVYIDMSGGSSKVTVWLRGQNPNGNSKSIACIYDYAQLEVIHGYNQVGATGGRLEEHLGVRVTDAKKRPVPGLRVTFDGAQDDSSFIPFPDTTVYASDSRNLDTEINDSDKTTVATSSSPDPTSDAADEPIYVQTDARGEAKVYYQLGESAEETQDVDVSAAGASDTFVLTADDDARRASLQMISMEKATGQGKEGIYYLSVIARSVGGHRIPNVIIEFEALSGSLRPRTGTSQPTHGTGAGQLPPDTTIATSGNEIFVITGVDGEAAVEYNVGPTDSTKVVTAEVHDEQGTLEYDFILDRVTFDVQHATSSTPDTTPDTTPGTTPGATPTLIVSRTNITGQPNSQQQVAITASQNAQVGNFFDSFFEANGSVSPTSGSGTFTATLTLPGTEGGPHTLTVSMGGQTETISVTVSSTAEETTTGGTLTLRIDPGSGAPRTSSTVTVTATDENGNPASGVPVSLTITPGGGVFSLPSVTTGTNGTATSILTRGSTPSRNYFITASASGYTFNSILPAGERIIISGPSTTTTTTTTTTTRPEAGEPAFVEIYDGDNQSGPLNAQLRDAFIVEVLDEDDNPVENVRVGFQVTQGRGRLSPRSARTDDDGFAEINFTPTSAGEITVRAKVSGVDAVDFTVTAGDPPASLDIVSGDNQAGTPGSRLANPLVVEVQDEDGDAIEGIRVAFSVVDGGGSLSETSDVTDEDGRAQTMLTLGSERAVNSVEASVSR